VDKVANKQVFLRVTGFSLVSIILHMLDARQRLFPPPPSSYCCYNKDKREKPGHVQKKKKESNVLPEIENTGKKSNFIFQSSKG
jgi:hypothetical protein